MTSAQFDRLSIDDQESMVFTHGAFIGVRQEPEFIIQLFQLNSFYVELFYHQVKERAIATRIFNDADKLGPYFDSIDLSGLLGL
jgi:hypothetical protein